MVDNNTNTVINTNTVHMTEKQKVKEITDRLEEGLRNISIMRKRKAIREQPLRSLMHRQRLMHFPTL